MNYISKNYTKEHAYSGIHVYHYHHDTALYIHARIATQGSLGIKNCHGFVDHETRLCFAHNGILNIGERADMTDSEIFFRDIFLPVYKYGGWREVEPIIREVINWGKFVFMDGNGKLRYFGNYIKGSDNVLYSNGTYQHYKCNYLYHNNLL